MSDTTVPDLESVPDLADLPRPAPRRGRLAERRARRAEPALVRAEQAARQVAARPGPPLVAVEVDDAPHVRLGLAWGALLLVCANGGTGWLALVLVPVAGAAAAQATRAVRRRGSRPSPAVAGLGAAAVALAAVGGVDWLLAACIALVPATFVAAAATRSPRPTRDAGLTLLAGATVGLAAAGPLLVGRLGTTEATVLIAFVCAYDVGAFVVGSGAASAWEGPIAGAVSTVPVTLVVAALFVEPFDGASPWLLGALAAVLAPAGPLAGTLLLGGPDGKAPALRRLDSLLVVGPVWAWAAAGLLGS